MSSTAMIWIGMDVHKDTVMVSVFEGQNAEPEIVQQLANDDRKLRRFFADCRGPDGDSLDGLRRRRRRLWLTLGSRGALVSLEGAQGEADHDYHDRPDDVLPQVGDLGAEVHEADDCHADQEADEGSVAACSRHHR